MRGGSPSGSPVLHLATPAVGVEAMLRALEGAGPDRQTSPPEGAAISGSHIPDDAGEELYRGDSETYCRKYSQEI